MNKKVYFAGSIRGGRVDAELYHRIITYIQRTDDVLTEHVGDLNLQESTTDKQIYATDTGWLRESDLVICEATCPSLGVGYELAYAEARNKPVYIFYDKSKANLSAMLTGDEYFHIFPYEREDEIYPVLDKILK
ncbi:MAG: nucleoside 2-deoxyribosyltransferase [Butyrivibrio sp.]|nr:nucleoside 2-deoxyribosyltransferase [Butyrivibrio sp.]